MIVVKVEIWPHGSMEDKVELAVGMICNDNTGSAMDGNYWTMFMHDMNKDEDEPVLRTGNVFGYDRSLPIWNLVHAALEDLATDHSSTQTDN